MLAALLALPGCDLTTTEPVPSRPDLTLPPELYGIAYGDGRFVAVGKRETHSRTALSSTWKALADTTVAVWSDDGVTWQPVTVPEKRGWLRDVAYGNGVFIATGGIGDWIEAEPYALRSTDGITCTKTAAPLGLKCNWIAFTNGVFVASCSEGRSTATRNVIARSTDGVSWQRAAEFGRFDTAITGEGGFFYRLDAELAWSTDGSGWQSVPRFWPAIDSIGRPVYGSVTAIAFTGTEYVGSGYSYSSFGEGRGPITTWWLRSNDGREWTAQPVAQERLVIDQAFGSNEHVAIALDGLYVENTLTSWTRAHAFDSALTSPKSDLYWDVVFAENRFVAVGLAGVLTSADGRSWVKSAIPLP